MEKKAGQRFQSARDLAFALRSLSNSSGTGFPRITKKRRISLWPAVAAALGVVAIGVTYLWMQKPEGLELNQYQFKPFAFTRAAEHSGVWSPDGKSVAYLEQSIDGTRLMVQSLDSTAPTELVAQVSGQPGQLAWSPDSNRIYFLGVGASLAGVSAVSRAGGVPERVIPNANFFHLSKDGATLAIWRGAQGNGNGSRFSVWISSPPGAAPVEYKPAPFAVPTPFTPVFLRFSPDGRKLFLSLYTDQGAQTWLLPYPMGTGEPRRIFSNIPWNRPVAGSWLPDSTRMVISGNPAPAVNEQLWLADVEKETLNKLLTMPNDGQSTPSVSPDGKRIVFAQVHRDRDIVEFPLDGSDPRTLLSKIGRAHV